MVGEILFPNTVPPFYKKAFHIAPPPTPEGPVADRADITPDLVATRLDEIPADSQCLAFQRTRAEWRGNKRLMMRDHPSGGPAHDGE